MLMKPQEHILIIGAGLCGCLMALRLAQRGYTITLVEKRPDLRLSSIDAGRSINLALSDRGLKALSMAGLKEKALAISLPMGGRMIHQKEQTSFYSPYSGNQKNAINSISRPGLNALLLDALDAEQNVSLHFNAPCIDLDLQTNTAGFKKDTSDKQSGDDAASFYITADVIFGCDGAGSVVRKTLEKIADFDFSLEWLSHGYKELSIAPGEDGDFQLRADALHIWPRGQDMIIALPNLDRSFTVTLFMGHQTQPYGFDHLTQPSQIHDYFKTQYPELLDLIPDLLDQYQNNPTGPLGTIKCGPWHWQGKAVIMGDAAHAIVPFYGQGMNASFEDVLVFDQLMDQGFDQWEDLLAAFSKKRKPDADAIANLALDNFYEMKEHTADAIFQKKRSIEVKLEQERPEAYQSKYSMVTFNPELSYHQAMTRGRAQDQAIVSLLKEHKLSESVDLDQQLMLIKKRTHEILGSDQS